jgi:hypothetical protein
MPGYWSDFGGMGPSTLSSAHNQLFPAEPGVPVPIGETVTSAAAAASAVVALVHQLQPGRSS